MEEAVQKIKDANRASNITVSKTAVEKIEETTGVGR